MFIYVCLNMGLCSSTEPKEARRGCHISHGAGVTGNCEGLDVGARTKLVTFLTAVHNLKL